METSEIQLIMAAMRSHDEKLDSVSVKIDQLRADFVSHAADDLIMFTKIKTVWSLASTLGAAIIAFLTATAVSWFYQK